MSSKSEQAAASRGAPPVPRDATAGRRVVLEMDGITKEFPGVRALTDVTLTVYAAEVHAICGENGAGKSTLMRVLSGVYPFGSYTGEIRFEGSLCEFHDVRASEAAGIVIIHQELAMVPEMSIMENIFLANEPRKHGVIDWDEAYTRTVELLAHVGLKEDPDTLVKDIGVGKQQLVEIAKALSKSVRLLILDEPTAALNEDDSQHLLDLIRGLRDRGITAIMISHKLAEIEQIADSITIIRDGEVVETLRVREDGVDENRIIRGMVGRAIESRFPDHIPRIGDVALEVRDWTVAHPLFPDRLVCKAATFTIHAGEIVGFAGLMGAGRTELARSIFGRSYGTHVRGELIKKGTVIAPKTVRQAIDHGLGYVTEDRKGLGLNLLDTIQATTVAANLSGVSRGIVIDDDREFAVAEDYREQLRTKCSSVSQLVSQLSGGNQQKVVLAKWMFADPDILILDEPTRGIDVGAKFEIYGIIQALARSGKAILFISSDLPELLGISDRIYTIFEGAVTGMLPRAEASQEALMRLMTAPRRNEGPQ